MKKDRRNYYANQDNRNEFRPGYGSVGFRVSKRIPDEKPEIRKSTEKAVLETGNMEGLKQ